MTAVTGTTKLPASKSVGMRTVLPVTAVTAVAAIHRPVPRHSTSGHWREPGFTLACWPRSGALDDETPSRGWRVRTGIADPNLLGDREQRVRRGAPRRFRTAGPAHRRCPWHGVW